MSKLDQLRGRDATHTITTRVDARYLATLILFWKTQGDAPKSLSELSRLSLESFAEFLVENNFISFVEDIDSALEIMRETAMMPGRVNTKTLARQLTKGEVSTSFLKSPDPAHLHKLRVQENPVSSVTVTSAVAHLQEMEQKEALERLKQSTERTSEFIKGLGEIPKEEGE